nr:MAG TPA: hypothetical protein [Bacteriophage sp.]
MTPKASSSFFLFSSGWQSKFFLRFGNYGKFI